MNVKHECYGKVHRLLKECRLIEPRIKKDMWIVWVGSTNIGEARLFEFDYYEDAGAAKAAGAAMRDSEYHENSEQLLHRCHGLIVGTEDSHCGLAHLREKIFWN